MTTKVEIENFYPSLEGFDEPTQILLGNFHQSKEASQLTRALKEVALAGIDLRNIKPMIAGKYFEGIAGLYVQSQLQSNNLFILTPSETDWIYQEFYAKAHTCLLYNLQTKIPGITVPDGLIFQRGKRYLQFKGVCEYTVQTNTAGSAQKQAQLEQYQQPISIAKDLGMYEVDCINNTPGYGQKLRELLNYIRPDIPRLPITLTNPDYWEIIYALPATFNERRGHLPYLPFNSKEFSHYIIQLLERITSEYQSEYQLLGIY
ncbi:MAG: hypothetical protein Q7R97_02120 [Candidatus Daviesbacteria bacterium]|nr:hypothetical protein [Candidatus Daviesbacteria bacterium]